MGTQMSLREFWEAEIRNRMEQGGSYAARQGNKEAAELVQTLIGLGEKIIAAK